MLPANEYDEETLMSFQEWKDVGYFVLKGARMRCRDAMGVPQFSKDQTTLGKSEWEAEHGIEEVIPKPRNDIRFYNPNYRYSGFLSVDHFDNICYKHHGKSMFEDDIENFEQDM